MLPGNHRLKATDSVRMKPYMCVICQKGFSRALRLQQHMMTDHGVNEESEDEEEEEERKSKDFSQNENEEGIAIEGKVKERELHKQITRVEEVFKEAEERQQIEEEADEHLKKRKENEVEMDEHIMREVEVVGEVEQQLEEEEEQLKEKGEEIERELQKQIMKEAEVAEEVEEQQEEDEQEHMKEKKEESKERTVTGKGEHMEAEEERRDEGMNKEMGMGVDDIVLKAANAANIIDLFSLDSADTADTAENKLLANTEIISLDVSGQSESFQNRDTKNSSGLKLTDCETTVTKRVATNLSDETQDYSHSKVINVNDQSQRQHTSEPNMCRFRRTFKPVNISTDKETALGGQSIKPVILEKCTSKFSKTGKERPSSRVESSKLIRNLGEESKTKLCIRVHASRRQRRRISDKDGGDEMESDKQTKEEVVTSSSKKEPKKKHRSLAQKIEDLRRANEETEVLNITVLENLLCYEGSKTRDHSNFKKQSVHQDDDDGSVRSPLRTDHNFVEKNHNRDTEKVLPNEQILRQSMQEEGDPLSSKVPISLQCIFCKEVFDNKGQLRTHMVHTCGIGNHRCAKCAKYFVKPSGRYLEDLAKAVEEARDLTDDSNHKLVKGKQIVVQFHQCIVCNTRFAVEKHLREHLKTHDDVACQFCNAYFPSTRELCRHIPVHNHGPLACPTCQQTFFSTYTLLLHMRGHTGHYQCRICHASFMFQSNLPRHMKQKHGNVQQVSRTSIDGYLQEGVPSKRQKIMTRDLNFKCDICGDLFRKEATLRQHIERFHTNIITDKEQFICEVCGIIKLSQKRLKNHMICHREPTMKCPECGKLFARSMSLKAHVEHMHGQRHEYPCQFCGKTLTSQVSLINHERLHTGEKPFSCAVCGKRFRLATSYRTHRAKAHSSSKPHSCNTCSKQFSVRAMLYKHLKTHLPRGKFTCNVCGKFFRREDLLRNHSVQHRREVSCRECGRNFSNEFALRYHTNKIHKIDLYQSDSGKLDSVADDIFSNSRATHSSSALDSESVHKDPLTVSIMETLPVRADEDSLDALPPPAAYAGRSGLGFDPGRLSDPTNLAISAILSELYKRV